MGIVYNKSNYVLDLPPRPPTESEYRYIIFDIASVRDNSETYVSLSDIRFLDSDGNAFVFPSGTEITSTLTTYPGEGAENLIDNNVNTKMTAYTWSSSRYESVLITLPEGKYLDIDTYNQFAWYTENYSSSRDPISWFVGVSKDNTSYTLVNSESNYSVTTSRSALAYTGPVAVPEHIFKYIRFKITKLRTNSSSYTQLSGLVFLNSTSNYIAYPSGTTVACSTSTSSGYPATNLIDNNDTTVTRCRWSSSSGRYYTITFPDDAKLDVFSTYGYGWVTGGNNTGYDPISWILSGANQSDFSDEFILDQQTDVDVTTSRNTLVIPGS